MRSDGPVAPGTIRLSEAQNHRCPYCGGEMLLERGLPHSATVEHVIPRSYGGTNCWLNVVAAHERCNQRRGDAPVDTDSYAIAMEGIIANREASAKQRMTKEMRKWKKFLDRQKRIMDFARTLENSEGVAFTSWKP
jgi:hypothetical protein